MTYTNELPKDAEFAWVSPSVSAEISVNDPKALASLLGQDVEITLPYDLRPKFGFAGKTVSFMSLLTFLQAVGSPLSRDRDLTLRAMAGTKFDYDLATTIKLPPQAVVDFGRDVLRFPTSYVLHVIADDMLDCDPDLSEELRAIAEIYFSDDDDYDCSEDVPPSTVKATAMPDPLHANVVHLHIEA